MKKSANAQSPSTNAVIIFYSIAVYGLVLFPLAPFRR